MAIQKTVESVGMKITVNHGEIGGKVVKTAKTYADIKEEVTDDAFLTTGKAIAKMQEPIWEKQVKVTAEDYIETV